MARITDTDTNGGSIHCTKFGLFTPDIPVIEGFFITQNEFILAYV